MPSRYWIDRNADWPFYAQSSCFRFMSPFLLSMFQLRGQPGGRDFTLRCKRPLNPECPILNTHHIALIEELNIFMSSTLAPPISLDQSGQ